MKCKYKDYNLLGVLLFIVYLCIADARKVMKTGIGCRYPVISGSDVFV